MPNITGNVKKIENFRTYEQNWNGYDAPPFSSALLDLAKEVLLQLDYQPEILPVAGGAIQFEYEKQDGSYLELEVLEDSEVLCFQVDERGDADSFYVTINEINNVVRNFYS